MYTQTMPSTAIFDAKFVHFEYTGGHMLKQVAYTGYLKLTLLTQVPSQPSFIAISSWCEATNKTSLQNPCCKELCASHNSIT